MPPPPQEHFRGCPANAGDRRSRAGSAAGAAAAAAGAAADGTVASACECAAMAAKASTVARRSTGKLSHIGRAVTARSHPAVSPRSVRPSYWPAGGCPANCDSAERTGPGMEPGCSVWVGPALTRHLPSGHSASTALPDGKVSTKAQLLGMRVHCSGVAKTLRHSSGVRQISGDPPRHARRWTSASIISDGALVSAAPSNPSPRSVRSVSKMALGAFLSLTSRQGPSGQNGVTRARLQNAP
mmetsp:Transcript_53674/g.136170  ORF Transcript_53674/g.136170 Transcript_53674/m.136170 type:complete len:241 (+) Transcript_53674:1175-1897(+)